MAHQTSSGHTASPSSSTSTAPAAATMTFTSPPSPAALPPYPAGPPSCGTTNNSSFHTCLSDLAAVLIVLVCFSGVAVGILYAARFIVRCVDRRILRAAWEEAQSREPKPASDSADGAGASPVPAAAGVWAEAECAICLSELIDDLEGGVRVLPACGHGFHAACVEAWLATRASCPTCRAPSSRRSSRPSSRTSRQP